MISAELVRLVEKFALLDCDLPRLHVLRETVNALTYSISTDIFLQSQNNTKSRLLPLTLRALIVKCATYVKSTHESLSAITAIRISVLNWRLGGRYSALSVVSIYVIRILMLHRSMWIIRDVKVPNDLRFALKLCSFQ